MCSGLFSVAMHCAILFILVLNVRSVVGENQGPHNVHKLLRTFWNDRSNDSFRIRSGRQPSNVSGTFSSDVTHPTIITRVIKPQTGNATVPRFFSLSSSFHSSSIQDGGQVNSQTVTPSKLLLLNSVETKNHSRIGQKKLTEYENVGHKLYVMTKEHNRRPVTSSESVLSSRRPGGVAQSSLRENERKDNSTLSSGFQYRNILHPGQNSLGKKNRSGSSCVNESDTQRLTSREKSAIAKSEEINRHEGHLDVSSAYNQKELLGHQNNSSSSRSARSFRFHRSPERFKRELFLKSERFIPRHGVIRHRSDRGHITWREFDSFADNIGINRIAFRDNKNWKSFLQPRQSETPEQPYLMDQESDSITASRLDDPYLNSPVNGFVNSPNSGRQAEAFQFNHPYFDTISKDGFSGVNQNFHNNILLTSSQREAEPQSHDSDLIKRQFDSIGNRFLSGMSQNHLGKRTFDYAGIASLPEMIRMMNKKRSFDAIGGGILSGIKQNHMGKRYYEYIFADNELTAVRHNYLNNANDGSSEKYDPNQRGFGYISSGLLDNEYNDMQDGLIDDALQRPTDNLKKDVLMYKNLVSLYDESINSLSQNNIKNYHSDPRSNTHFGDVTSSRGPLTKRLDAISDGALRGIRQNFFDKKYFDFLSKEPMPQMQKNFLPKRYFNSFGAGFYRGSWKNFMTKRDFGSPSLGFIWILDNKFQSKKNSLSFSFNPSDKLIYNDNNKQKIDSSSRNSLDDFNPNVVEEQIFPDKRSFDSISTNSMSGSSQNFLGNRKYITPSYNGRNNLYQNVFNKRQFQSGEKIYFKSPKTLDHHLLTDSENEGSSHFPSDGSSEITIETDYDGDFGRQDETQQSHERAPFDLIPRFVYVGRVNLSPVSDSLSKRQWFESISLQDDHNKAQNDFSDKSGLMKAREQGEIDMLSTDNDLPDKKSFDAIDSFSSLSGIDQNFMDSTASKHRRIGSLPWMLFTKRNVVDGSSELKMEENDYRPHTTGHISLLQDSDLSISKKKASHENAGGYIINFKPSLLDRSRLSSFLPEHQDSNHFIKLHVGTDDETDDIYEDNVDTLQEERIEDATEERDKHQNPTEEIESRQSTLLETNDN